MNEITPKRKGGAQPGNRNALKHALYARHYPESTRKTLLTWDVKDQIGEIHLLRASMDSIAELIMEKKDIPANERVALTNAISRASSTLSVLVQRHFLLNTRDDPVYIAWDEATHERQFFTDGEPPL
jgi:hypothetical protein